jgi:hypothetical protein
MRQKSYELAHTRRNDLCRFGTDAGNNPTLMVCMICVWYAQEQVRAHALSMVEWNDDRMRRILTEFGLPNLYAVWELRKGLTTFLIDYN